MIFLLFAQNEGIAIETNFKPETLVKQATLYFIFYIHILPCDYTSKIE